jgi:hypothetical protein
MTAWDVLRYELDAAAADGRTVRFWWRDDDTTERSPFLDTLLELSGGRPVAISVIPALVDWKLGPFLRAHFNVTVLQHGWSHHNHSKELHNQAELGPDRPEDLVLDQLLKGHKRLRTVFGKQFVPILTPPWHQLNPHLIQHLARIGFIGLSSGGWAQPWGTREKLIHLPVHLDLTDWSRSPYKFVGSLKAIVAIGAHLRAKRLGQIDPLMPTGILTHCAHLDEDTRHFLKQLFDLTAHLSQVRWQAIEEMCEDAASLQQPE